MPYHYSTIYNIIQYHTIPYNTIVTIMIVVNIRHAGFGRSGGHQSKKSNASDVQGPCSPSSCDNCLAGAAFVATGRGCCCC